MADPSKPIPTRIPLPPGPVIGPTVPLPGPTATRITSGGAGINYDVIPRAGLSRSIITGGSSQNVAGEPDPKVVAENLKKAAAAAGTSNFDAIAIELGLTPLGGGRYITPDGQIFTQDQILAGGLYGASGFGGSGGAGSVHIPQYDTQVINGQVYRISGDTGIPEPTGLFVDPTITSTTTNRAGDLIGLKSDGTVTIIQPGFDYAKADPNIETVTSNVNGKTYERNKVTGELKEIGQFDFPGIDPEREFALRQAQETRLAAADAANRAEGTRQFDVTNSRLQQAQDQANAISQRERGLAENQAVAEILRNPADFLARAFFERGAASPTSRITNADLINSLTRAISGASNGTVAPSGTIAGQPGGSRLSVPTPSAVPVPAKIAAAPTATGTPLTYAQEQTRLNNLQRSGQISVGEAISRLQNYPTGLPVTGSGGVEKATMASTDASSDPVAIRNALLAGAAPTVVGDKTYSLNPAGVLSYTDTSGNGGTIDTSNIERDRAYAAALANGDIEEPVGPAQVTQESIIDMARRYSPPAVNAVINGTTEQLPTINLGFATPTLRQTSRLTPDETAAFGTRIGAEFNTTIPDVQKAQQELFAGTRSRQRSRLVV